MVPKLYSYLAAMPGNFSVLQLPAQPSQSSSLPLLSIGKSTYYTSITHKPLVGGYVTRSNITDTLSLYNIPLVMQDQWLSAYGSLNSPSPIIENYTNQTLLTLFNYNTAYVVIDETAYNSSSLSKIGAYLVSMFGNPVYADNTTAAFSTSKAINASLFRSYVAYPIPIQWQSSLLPSNGTYRLVWSPYGSGAVVVYAPYKNTTGIPQKIQSGVSYGINTTVSVYAQATTSPQKLYILEQVGSSTKTLTQFNLTTTLTRFALNLTLPSGPVGSTLFFMPGAGSTNASIAISGITFTRRYP